MNPSAGDDDLEPRVSALEQDVRELRQRVALSAADAGAARVLAAGADRDVSDVRAELRAHSRVLHALRETQLEHDRRFRGLEGRFDGLEGRFDGLGQRLTAFEGQTREGFAMMGVGMAEIVAILRRIEGDADDPDLS